MAGGAHAQLARRVAGEKVTLHTPAIDHPARLHAHALLVERRRALAGADEGVFLDVDVPGKHRLAERVEQKAGLAVQRAAAHRLREAAQQAGGQRRLEQHRAFARGDLAALQAAQGAFGGVAAHRLRAGQLGGIAHRAVPVVALHVGALAGDRRHRDAVARRRIATAKTARVGAEEMALLRRHTGAFAVGDALGLGQGADQFVGQAQCIEQVGAQAQQVLAQVLQRIAFALQVGAARVVGAFELGFEFDVQFAAFGNKLTAHKIAFFGFA